MSRFKWAFGLTVILSFSFLSKLGASEWAGDGLEFRTQAELLPRGRASVALSTQHRNIKSFLINSGQSQKLGHRHNESRSMGQDRLANRNYEFSLKQTQFVPTYLYGLTNQWSLGVRLPVTHSKISMRKSAQVRSTEGVFKIQSQLQEKEIFGNEGVSESEGRTEIGNVELLSKVRLFSAENMTLAATQLAYFPSAEKDVQDVYLDPIPSPRGYGLGGGLALDYFLMKRLTTSASVNYSAYMKDKVGARTGIEEEYLEVKRDPGDELALNLSGHLLLKTHFKFSAGYQYRNKDKDQYEENPFLTLQERVREHAVDFKIGYYSLTKSALTAPFSMNVSYVGVLQGSNVRSGDILGLNFQTSY